MKRENLCYTEGRLYEREAFEELWNQTLEKIIILKGSILPEGNISSMKMKKEENILTWLEESI